MDGSPLPPALPQQVEEACDRFEAAWKAAEAGGPRPRIEEYLGPGTGTDHPALVPALVELDVYYRGRCGEAPRPDDYLPRFPVLDSADLAGIIRDCPVAPDPPAPPRTAHRRPASSTQPDPQRTTPEAVPAAAGGDVDGAAAQNWPRIPGYEVLGELGRGGMGVVYRARHLALKRLVALKVVLAGDHADSATRERFQIEAEAVARLQHVNVVQIYDVGTHNGLPYCALELVEGGSLANKLQGRPQSPRYAVAVVQALARAIHAAHMRGIVHRDLKPANVLLTPGGTPKVTDFGLAKRLDESGRTHAGQVIGTPSYMAPEQAAGRTAEVGPLSDVYGLGAILYEMLAGRPPFRGKNVADTLRQVCEQPPVSPRGIQPAVPRDLAVICLKCLEKQAEQRYGSAEALADDLRRFLSGFPIRARPLGVAGRAGRWGRRHPWAALSGVLVGCAALLGLALWLTRPAYLDLHVSPADADVSFNGEAVLLSDGAALLARDPGEYALEVRADGYLPHRETVVLARGRGNAAPRKVDLVSEFGILVIDSIPPGAAVEVVDESGKVRASGVTPEFRSKRLLNGDYVVRLSRDLYLTAEERVTVRPGGDESKPAPVRLQLIDGASEAARLSEFWHKAEQTRLTLNIPNPDTRIGDVFRLIEKQTGIPLSVNAQSFRDEQVEDVDMKPIGKAFSTPAPSGEPLLGALSRLLERMPTATGTDIVPRKLGERYALEVTTKRYSQYFEKFQLFHAVGDLMDGPDGMTEDEIVVIVRSAIPLTSETGGFGTPQVRFVRTGRAVFVESAWVAQRAVGVHLEKIREARLTAGPTPGAPATNTSRDNLVLMKSSAWTHLNHGEWGQARDILARAVEKFPTDLENRLLLINIYGVLGQEDKMPPHYTFLLEKSPAARHYLVKRAQAWARLGKFADALADQEEFCKLGNGDERLVDEPRVPLLVLAGRERDSRNVIATSVSGAKKERDPVKAGRAARSCVLAPGAMNGLDEAEQLIKLALERDPRNRWYLITQGMIYYRTKRTGEAEKAFKASLAVTEVTDSYAQAGGLLGQALAAHARGKMDQARSRLAEARKLLEYHPPFWSYTNLDKRDYWWPDYLVCLVWAREAQSLLDDGKP